jgi:hypothetical protein
VTGNGTGLQSKKVHPNPFVAYEDREVRLQQEKRWLLHDAKHLSMRTRELTVGSTIGKLTRESRDPEEFYDERMSHTPYAVKIKALVAMRQELRRLRNESEGTLKDQANTLFKSGTMSMSMTSLRDLSRTRKLEGAIDDLRGSGRKPKRGEKVASCMSVKLIKEMQEWVRGPTRPSITCLKSIDRDHLTTIYQQ